MPTLTVWPVRDCGRFPIKVHEKLKRATYLRIPLKPLLATPCVGHSYLFVYHCFNLVECLFCFNFIFEIDDNFVPIIFGHYQIWK